VVSEALSTPPLYDTEGLYDEALTADGRPRPQYAALLAALTRIDLEAAERAARDHADELGVSFGTVRFPVDPVPRIFESAEWDLVERGLLQRKLALNAFIADVYGERRMVEAGEIPTRAIESADHFEPWMIGVELRHPHAPLAGLDLVRDDEGGLDVLEDNLRTPSGFAYRRAVRAAVDAALPFDPPRDRAGMEPDVELLGQALREAAPRGGGDPSIALLSDGSDNSAWFEHRELARLLGIPLVTRDDLAVRGGRLHARLGDGATRELQVLYRRTDEDRLRDESGRPTWLAEALLDPVRRGHLAVVNAFGTGVADDKLVYAYVEAMIRFFLKEEPLLRSVHTYDLGDTEEREAALKRIDELVIKPRSGHGGRGIVVARHADDEDRAAIAAAIREQPERFVAQETIEISRHPTVCGGSLQPRHVDLRAFAVGSGVLPGGLTRVAFERGSLVVNSSQNGGAKDTWVVR
jgi:uncharacterized circularly permuted ATP-grasp superfamily protein